MSTATATAPLSQMVGAEKPPLLDVWSRTAPKYRRRAVFMLILMGLLFAGLCCFTFWLRTGVYWPWDSDLYTDLMRRSWMPSGRDQITLSQFLSSPISVQDVPIHGVTMGVLFASLCSIPILVSILYRFPFSVFFAAMVMFLAALPWLGLTILAGCALASLPPFRFSFRYASALIGLIPIAIYFVSASWEPAGSRQGPTQNLALLYAPWVLALLSSCVICAFALFIAKLINYRPGGIPPLLAALFAVPVVLFHTQVGRDELEYRVLEQELGPGRSRLFAHTDIGVLAAREATRRGGETREESYSAIYQSARQQAAADALAQIEIDRQQAVDACDGFIENFPNSRYVANVLFLKGQAQDERMLKTSLIRNHRVEFRSDLPVRGSRQTWETIRERFPNRDLCCMALYKLAILDGREGKLSEAIEHLDTLLQRFDASLATTQPQATASDARAYMFERAHPSEGLGFDLAAVVFQARCLREMLVACQPDHARRMARVLGVRPESPTDNIHPAQLLISLDDADEHYSTNLDGIARHFPESQTAGYAEIRLALLEPAVSRRIARFRRAATSLDKRAAAPEALYHLGEVLEEDSILDEAREKFDELVRNYPSSCWAAEAAEKLSSLPLMEIAE